MTIIPFSPPIHYIDPMSTIFNKSTQNLKFEITVHDPFNNKLFELIHFKLVIFATQHINPACFQKKDINLGRVKFNHVEWHHIRGLTFSSQWPRLNFRLQTLVPWRALDYIVTFNTTATNFYNQINRKKDFVKRHIIQNFAFFF